MAGLIPSDPIADANRIAREFPGGAATPDDLPGPGFFAGFGSAVAMSAMGGFASAARAPLFAIGGTGAVLADRFADARKRDAYFASGGQAKFAPSTENQDAFFGGDALSTVNDAVNYWTPDARTTSAASRFVGGFVRLGTEAMSGGALSVIGSEMINTDVDLVDKGVDADTAGKVGLVAGAQNAVGLGFAGFGGPLVQRFASNIAANLVFNAGATALEHKTLDDAGHSAEAEQFHTWDPHARALDVLAGMAMTAMHRGAPPASLAQQDAILTAANAQRVQTTSAPAAPATPAGQAAHVSAFDAAVAAVTRGENVNVAATLDPADFQLDKPNPQLAGVTASVRSGTILSNLTGPRAMVRDAAITAGVDPHIALAIAKIESNFDPAAKNPNSSAVGIGQFLDSTWRDMGGTAENRFDPATQSRLLAELTVKNTDALRDTLGREPQPQEVYLAHLLGIGGAKKLLSAAPDALVADVAGKRIADQNGMAGMTVAQAVDHWQGKVERAGADATQSSSETAYSTSGTPRPEPASTRSSATTGDSVVVDPENSGTRSIATNDTPVADRVNTTSGIQADFDTARETAEANPNLVVHDDDGNPMLVNDAIAATDAHLAAENRFASAYDVAVSCLLRGGH